VEEGKEDNDVKISNLTSMIQILKTGKLFKPNKDGNLVNEASIGKIRPPWKSAVEAVKESYIHNLGDLLHSVYIRGTVARGKAVEEISDVDSTAVVLKVADFDPTWFQVEQRKLKNQFQFVSKFEFSLIPIDELLDPKKRISQKFFLKTQSVCIYGEDVAKQIPEFKITDDLAQRFYRGLESDIKIAKANLTKNKCQWIAKRILRAGFALVMVREQAYTRDLYPSYEVFSKYYPNKEKEMKKALELAINPIDDRNSLLQFLDSFGGWLISKF
jgi:hypothetical protein